MKTEKQYGRTVPTRYVTKRLGNLNYVILPWEKRGWNKKNRNRHDPYRTLEYEQWHHRTTVKKIKYSKNSVEKTGEQSGEKKSHLLFVLHLRVNCKQIKM